MTWLSKIKESPNYARLRNSLEFRYVRRQALLIGIPCGIILLLAILVGAVGGDLSARSAFTFAMGLVFLLPVSAYYIYRLVSLFFSIDRYVFTEVLLDRPHMGGRYGAYFTVTVRDRSGRELQRDTSCMFGNMHEPCFDDCVNKKMLIGYNEETDRVVVIRRVGD